MCCICGEREQRAREKCSDRERDCELREFRVRESRECEFRDRESRNCELRDRESPDRHRESRVRGFCDRECREFDFREDDSDLERDREYSTVRILSDVSQCALEGVLPLERE